MRQSPFNPISPRIIAPFYASPYINGRQTFPQIFISTGLETLCGQVLDIGDSYVSYEASQSVLVKNTGIDTLTIFSIAFVGDADGFSLVPLDLPITIEPDQTFALDIEFLASSPGVHTGTLVVTSDSISSPVCSIDVTSTATAGSPGLNIESLTYLGDFQWCGYLPYSNTYQVPAGATLSNSSYVPYHFRRLSWEGDIYQKEYNPFADLNDPFAQLDGQVRHFVGDDGPGEIVVDDETCATSGQLNMKNRIGFPGTNRLCAGSSFSYFVGTVDYDGSSTAGLYEMIQNNYTYWKEIILSGNRKTFFASNNLLAPSGLTYQGSPCGQAITGVGSVSEVLSDPMPLSSAARNGGAVEIPTSFRSEITVYDQTAKTMSGEASVLHLTSTVPSVSGTLLATLYFTKTPTGGGEAEEISIEIEQEVGVGSLMDIEVLVPMLSGYTIELASSTVTDVIELMDDFSAQASGRLLIGLEVGYVQAQRWAQANPYFAMDVDDQTIYAFASWDAIAATSAYGLDQSGGYWAGDGVFNALDGAATSDTFEDQNSPQTITSLSRGLGWAGPGILQVAAYPEFREDWEGIIVGSGLPLPEYPATSGILIAISFHWWSFGGVFQSPHFGPQLDPQQYSKFSTIEYLFIYDEFQSYSTGPITLLTGGTGWDGDGYFTT